MDNPGVNNEHHEQEKYKKQNSVYDILTLCAHVNVYLYVALIRVYTCVCVRASVCV